MFATTRRKQRGEFVVVTRLQNVLCQLGHCSCHVAALFVQELNDPHVLAAVDEVSGLTNGLSQKVWQKLTILEAASND